MALECTHEQKTHTGLQCTQPMGAGSSVHAGQSVRPPGIYKHIWGILRHHGAGRGDIGLVTEVAAVAEAAVMVAGTGSMVRSSLAFLLSEPDPAASAQIVTPA